MSTKKHGYHDCYTHFSIKTCAEPVVTVLKYSITYFQ